MYIFNAMLKTLTCTLGNTGYLACREAPDRFSTVAHATEPWYAVLAYGVPGRVLAAVGRNSLRELCFADGYCVRKHLLQK